MTTNLHISLPHYMLRQMLSLDIGTDGPPNCPSGDTMNLIHFDLVGAGICNNLHAENASLNTNFSRTLLETMKLLLQGSLIRRQSQNVENDIDQGYEVSDVQKLISGIDEVYDSGKLLVGGLFPLLIAQRSPMIQDR